MIRVYRLVLLALLVLLWTLAAQQFGRNVVPTPLATLEAAQRLVAEGRLAEALGASLSVYLAGYALAVVCAIPIGVVMGGFRTLGKTLEIFVFALAATPRVAFIPLIIVILGLGANAKIFIIFLGALMSTILRIVDGLREADSGREEVFGAAPKPGPDIGLVFHTFRLIPWATAQDSVEFRTEEHEAQPRRAGGAPSRVRRALNVQ